MKYFSILLLLILAACNDNSEAINCQEADYNERITLRIGEKVCFPDGNAFELKEVIDEFCPCFMLCIWEGELEVMIETETKTGEKALLTFGSSTYTLNNTIFEGYKVSELDYAYNGQVDNLPDCENEFDSDNIQINFRILHN